MNEPKIITIDQQIASAVASYSPADSAIAELAERYMPLTVASPQDSEGYAVARAARLEIKALRVGVEKTRKALKADALVYGRAVDGEAKRITALLEPIETHLQNQEKVVTDEQERILAEKEAQRQAVLRERMAKLAAVQSALLPVDVQDLDDAAFAAALADATASHEELKRKEAEEAAERARLEAEAAEARKAEDERLRVERAALEKQRQEQAAAQAKIAEERRKVDAERAVKEAAERAEREAKERAEREAAEAKRRAELLPEAEKLRAFAALVEALDIPAVSCSARLREIVRGAADQIRGCIPAEIRREA